MSCANKINHSSKQRTTHALLHNDILATPDSLGARSMQTRKTLQSTTTQPVKKHKSSRHTNSNRVELNGQRLASQIKVGQGGKHRPTSPHLNVLLEPRSLSLSCSLLRLRLSAVACSAFQWGVLETERERGRHGWRHFSHIQWLIAAAAVAAAAAAGDSVGQSSWKRGAHWPIEVPGQPLQKIKSIFIQWNQKMLQKVHFSLKWVSPNCKHQYYLKGNKSSDISHHKVTLYLTSMLTASL